MSVITFAATPAVTGRLPVALYESNLIAQANQKRIAVAERAAPRLEALRTEINRLDHVLAEHAAELSQAWSQVRTDDARAHAPPLKSGHYNLLIGLLVVLEIPVNAAAFDFLRIGVAETYAAALALGLISAWAAKSTARIVRQNRWADRAWRDWSIAGLVNAALLIAFLAMAQLRSLQAEQDLAAFAFLALQLAFYAAALVCGFLQLDPSAHAEQLGRRIKARRATLDTTWKARAKLAATHNQILAAADLRIRSVVADAQERIAQYRDSNVLWRTRGPNAQARPSWFGRGVPAEAFVPVSMGVPVDEHPRTIGAVVADPFA